MRHEVTENDTADALGSGDVQALATPRLIAWLETGTVRAATPVIDHAIVERAHFVAAIDE